MQISPHWVRHIRTCPYCVGALEQLLPIRSSRVQHGDFLHGGDVRQRFPLQSQANRPANRDIKIDNTTIT